MERLLGVVVRGGEHASRVVAAPASQALARPEPQLAGARSLRRARGPTALRLDRTPTGPRRTTSPLPRTQYSILPSVFIRSPATAGP